MATLLAAGALMAGIYYWNKAMGQPGDAKPDGAFAEIPASVDDPSSRPRSSMRDTAYAPKAHRVGGELKMSPYNQANNPYAQSPMKTDPALERQAARIVHAPTIEELTS